MKPGAATPSRMPTQAPHAALMDKVYRRQRHIYDLTRKYYLLGRDRLIRELGVRQGGAAQEAIIEIGCGTARNLIRIGETYRNAELYGLDASREMLHTASEAAARAGLAERIVLEHALAEDLTPSLFGRAQPFDHAIFSYSLSMIPDWRGALASAAAHVRPGGFVHVVDFGDLKGLWPPLEWGLRAWLRLFHVAPRDELLSALEKLVRTRKDASLTLLPGRYAFVLKANPSAIWEISETGPVAKMEQSEEEPLWQQNISCVKKPTF
jgi:S-adenosylmethionine-diacylgycerolhomoserine-N-methlytransferase